MLASRISGPVINRMLLEVSQRACVNCRVARRDWCDVGIPNEKPGAEKVGWTTIYKLPYIGIVSAMNRTKYYQLGATVLGCPFAYAMEMSGVLGSGTAIVCAAVGLSATITTTAFSWLSSGTVGFFYSNEDDSKVRFAYVDANGRRRDVVADVEAVQSKGENRFLMRIAVHGDTKVQLKLFHSHGIILNVGKFNSIL